MIILCFKQLCLSGYSEEIKPIGCAYTEKDLLKGIGSCATPMNCSPPGSSALGVFQARILENFLLQGIFLTQGSNPGLPCCRQLLCHLRHQGSPVTVDTGKSQPAVWASNGRLETQENQWRRQSLEASAGGVSPAWGGWSFFFFFPCEVACLSRFLSFLLALSWNVWWFISNHSCFRRRCEMAIRSLLPCVHLGGWGFVRWPDGLSIRRSSKLEMLSLGNLRCVEFLKNPLTPGGGGGIVLAKGTLEIEFCLDQIRIYFSCLWPWIFTGVSIPEGLFPSGSVVKNLPAMEEMWVWSLGQEDPLEKQMATHSSILVWEIPWTEEPCGLQPMGFQRVRHTWVSKQHEVSQSLAPPQCSLLSEYASFCCGLGCGWRRECGSQEVTLLLGMEEAPAVLGGWYSIQPLHVLPWASLQWFLSVFSPQWASFNQRLHWDDSRCYILGQVFP